MAQPNNGLVCAAGGVLRIFGKALAFESGHCAPYRPYVYGTAATHAKVDAPPRVRLRLAAHGGAPIELIATRSPAMAATSALPASLDAGNYTLMVKANPNSTWERRVTRPALSYIVVPTVQRRGQNYSDTSAINYTTHSPPTPGRLVLRYQWRHDYAHGEGRAARAATGPYLGATLLANCGFQALAAARLEDLSH